MKNKIYEGFCFVLLLKECGTRQTYFLNKKKHEDPDAKVAEAAALVAVVLQEPIGGQAFTFEATAPQTSTDIPRQFGQSKEWEVSLGRRVEKSFSEPGSRRKSKRAG